MPTQSAPCVTATAICPSGKVKFAGIGGVIGLGKRVTTTATTVMTPTTMLAVKAITNHCKARTGAVSTTVLSSGVCSMSESLAASGILHVIVGENPPTRLDKLLARDAPEGLSLSRSRFAKLIEDGAVRRGDHPLGPKDKVTPGETLAIHLSDPEPDDAQPEDIPLVVVYEDADLIVIDKPVGLVVHPAVGHTRGTLVNALLHHCGDSLSGIGGAKRPGIVHRIDKDTSGLIVVAKSDRAHQGLARQFEDHTVTRRYLALVHGQPSAADPRLRGIRGVGFEDAGVLRIATQIDRHRTDRQRQAVVPLGGRHAITRARPLETFGTPPALCLLECWLETGRTHQIRVHMSHIGHPLVGDATYGGRRRASGTALGPNAALVDAFPRQALHAATLGFDHPATGARLDFTSPLPPDMQDLLDQLT